MTPIEKAKELVYKYWDIEDIDFLKSKQCALIAVNEILDQLDEIINITGSSYVFKIIDFYNEVKQEIEKI